MENRGRMMKNLIMIMMMLLTCGIIIELMMLFADPVSIISESFLLQVTSHRIAIN